MNTAFHRCLAELDAAEDAWFNDEGNGKYVEWAHNYTALVRGLLQMTCKDIDASKPGDFKKDEDQGKLP